MTSIPAPSWFDQLVGTWTGTGQIFPNPWGPAGPSEGAWRFWRDPGERYLLQDFSEQRPGATPFHAHGVLMPDPATGQILWFWFDSYGFPPLPPAQGAWADDRLLVEKTTARGTGRTELRLAGNQFFYRIDFRAPEAADFTPILKGEYGRV